MIKFDEVNYYHGYLLDDVITEDDMVLLDAYISIVEDDRSIRKASANHCCSKSKLHRFIHNGLRRISYELYRLCVKRLRARRKSW